MYPELAVFYAKLDIYEGALERIVYSSEGSQEIAQNALDEATKLSQPASQPEKPKGIINRG